MKSLQISTNEWTHARQTLTHLSKTYSKSDIRRRFGLAHQMRFRLYLKCQHSHGNESIHHLDYNKDVFTCIQIIIFHSQLFQIHTHI